MSRNPISTVVVDLGAAVACAAAATWVKTQAEAVLQPLAERLLPPAPAQLVEIGADPGGHPENMPPAEVADRAVHAVTGDELSDDARGQAASALHWVMGIGAGVAYIEALQRRPWVGAGRGSAFGVAMFAATHGSTLPATGMQHPPWRLPRAWWIWEGGSHVVYAVAVDTLWRSYRRVANRVR